MLYFSVDCGFGSFYDTVSKTCILCKKGTYQDEEGQQYCKTCPSGTDTPVIGAKNIKDCKGITAYQRPNYKMNTS